MFLSDLEKERFDTLTSKVVINHGAAGLLATFSSFVWLNNKELKMKKNRRTW